MATPGVAWDGKWECQCSPHNKCCKIQPSMLASDLANLASEAKSVLAAGADELHIDVMDGHFVPNITFAHPVVSSLRKNVPDAYLDCHMMVSKPSQWVEPVACMHWSWIALSFHWRLWRPVTSTSRAWSN